jgi:hypothetical protein
VCGLSRCPEGEAEPTQNAGVHDHTVVWISRAKFEATHKLYGWQLIRKLSNEADVIRMMQVGGRKAR